MKDGVLDFEKAIEIQARVELGIQDSALREAQKGDWSLLAGHIRHGGRITPQMRPCTENESDPTRKLVRVEPNFETSCFYSTLRRRADTAKRAGWQRPKRYFG